MLRVAGILNESIVDGPGIRAVVFFQGCPRHCEGCHNPSTLPFEGGMEYTPEDLAQDVIKRLTPLHRGITLSGGDPLAQADVVLEFLQAIKKLKPGLNVWCYTGYTLEQLLQEADPDRMALLRETDVLVDGPFLLAQRSLELKYCGSRNQRLIDVKKTLSSGVPTLWEPPVW